MTEIEKKTGMTDADCVCWDDYYTKNCFEPGPNLLKQGGRPGAKFARSFAKQNTGNVQTPYAV